MFGSDEVGAIVIDTGTSSIRAGYAGEDTPKYFQNTPVGYHGPEVLETSQFVGSREDTSTTDSVLYKSTNHKYYIGTSANIHRPNQEIIAPVHHGLIMDFDAITASWDHAFKSLHVYPYDAPLLMTEPIYNTKSRRERVAQIMFEQFNTPAFFFMKEPVACAFSQGKANALIVDIGASKISVIPVHDGYALLNASYVTKIGGDSFDAFVFRNMLQPKGITNIPAKFEYTKKMTPLGKYQVVMNVLQDTTSSYLAYQQQQTVTDLRINTCVVHAGPIDEYIHTRTPLTTYSLPDGNNINIGVEKYLLGEALFNPDLGLGLEITQDMYPQRPFLGLHKAVCSVVDQTDVDLRKELYSNVFGVGGGFLMPGLHARLQAEISSLIPIGVKCKVNAPLSNIETKFASWIGGSILATLGTFHQMWISRAEYEEYGAGILMRKCP